MHRQRSACWPADAPDIAEVREILADIVGEDRRAGEVITRLRALIKRGETRLLPLPLNEVDRGCVAPAPIATFSHVA